MILNKIVNGYVSQLYDTDTGRFISQEFVAADEVEWEFQSGLPVLESITQSEGLDRACCVMNMEQPDRDWNAAMLIIKNLARAKSYFENDTYMCIHCEHSLPVEHDDGAGCNVLGDCDNDQCPMCTAVKFLRGNGENITKPRLP